MDSNETFEGFVIDIACMRKYPHSQLFQRAQSHSRACGLMGHCMESGYGLVNETGIALLDPQATPMIANVLFHSNRDHGIRIRVERTISDDVMHTVRAEEIV